MSEGKSKGGEASEIKLDTLILTYDRGSDHLEIGGAANSLDLMLDMLARATRTLEARLRAQNVLALQQQMQEQARTQAIVDSVAGRR